MKPVEINGFVVLFVFLGIITVIALYPTSTTIIDKNPKLCWNNVGDCWLDSQGHHCNKYTICSTDHETTFISQKITLGSKVVQ